MLNKLNEIPKKGSADTVFLMVWCKQELDPIISGETVKAIPFNKEKAEVKAPNFYHKLSRTVSHTPKRRDLGEENLKIVLINQDF